MKYCQGCGAQSDDSAKKCQECNQPFPKAKKLHGCLIALFVFLAIFFIIIVVASFIAAKQIKEEKLLDSSAPTVATTEPPQPVEPLEPKPTPPADTAKEEPPSNTPQEEPGIDAEAIKQKVIETDALLFDYVLKSGENFNSLLDAMDDADMNANGLLSIYEKANAVIKSQQAIITNISNYQKGETEKYAQACSSYASNVDMIAKNMIKFADTNDMKYLAKLNERLEYSDTLTTDVVAERMDYFTSQGFTNEEIIALFETE